MNYEITITITQLISIVLAGIVLFIGVYIMLPNWNYKLNKPYKWVEEAKKTLPSRLKMIEQNYDDKVRFYTFWFQIERLKRESIKGAFAELGVYKGETARFTHLMDDSREFHLFDTFDGFKEDDLKEESSDDKKYSTDNFSDTSLERVKDFIDGNENIFLHKGYFPETANKIKEEEFAFVHLDADLYKPTLAGLKYFYPRLAKGGVMFIHDYNHTWDGVRKAIEEFRKDNDIIISEVADMQGSLMVLK